MKEFWFWEWTCNILYFEHDGERYVQETEILDYFPAGFLSKS